MKYDMILEIHMEDGSKKVYEDLKSVKEELLKGKDIESWEDVIIHSYIIDNIGESFFIYKGGLLDGIYMESLYDFGCRLMCLDNKEEREYVQSYFAEHLENEPCVKDFSTVIDRVECVEFVSKDLKCDEYEELYKDFVLKGKDGKLYKFRWFTNDRGEDFGTEYIGEVQKKEKVIYIYE